MHLDECLSVELLHQRLLVCCIATVDGFESLKHQPENSRHLMNLIECAFLCYQSTTSIGDSVHSLHRLLVVSRKYFRKEPWWPRGKKGPALWLRTCFKQVSEIWSFASSLIFKTLVLSTSFCVTCYVFQFNLRHLWYSAEYGRMQKQPSQAFFASRLLLIPKSYPVRSRHLHPSTVDYPIPTQQLKLLSSASRPSKRGSSDLVTEVYHKRQIRRESTFERAIGAEKEKQNKAPWHREGSDVPPVARQRSAGAMVKGSRVCLRAPTLLI